MKPIPRCRRLSPTTEVTLGFGSESLHPLAVPRWVQLLDQQGLHEQGSRTGRRLYEDHGEVLKVEVSCVGQGVVMFSHPATQVACRTDVDGVFAVSDLPEHRQLPGVRQRIHSRSTRRFRLEERA